LERVTIKKKEKTSKSPSPAEYMKKSISNQGRASKKPLKGTKEEKTARLGLKFTPTAKEELEKYKLTLGCKTFNAVLYKLIELGKEQHKKDLQKIIEEK
jgi:hypothetical protein